MIKSGGFAEWLEAEDDFAVVQAEFARAVTQAAEKLGFPVRTTNYRTMSTHSARVGDRNIMVRLYAANARADLEMDGIEQTTPHVSIMFTNRMGDTTSIGRDYRPGSKTIIDFVSEVAVAAKRMNLAVHYAPDRTSRYIGGSPEVPDERRVGLYDRVMRRAGFTRPQSRTMKWQDDDGMEREEPFDVYWHENTDR